MSEQAVALGAPEEIVFRGRAWKFGPVTFAVERLFIKWVEDRAVAAAHRHSRTLQRLGSSWQMNDLFDSIAACRYEWNGKTTAEARGSFEGTKELIWLAVTLHHNDFTRDMLDALAEDETAWADAVQKLIKLLSTPKNSGTPQEAGTS